MSLDEKASQGQATAQSHDGDILEMGLGLGEFMQISEQGDGRGTGWQVGVAFADAHCLYGKPDDGRANDNGDSVVGVHGGKVGFRDSCAGTNGWPTRC